MDREKIQEYKEACRAFLKKGSLEGLRGYARSIGSQKPTTLAKKALIEEIIALSVGEMKPNRKKSGAPVKNDFVDPKIVEGMENLKKEYEVEPQELEENQEQVEERLEQESVLANEEKNYDVQLVVHFSDLTTEQKEKLSDFIQSLKG